MEKEKRTQDKGGKIKRKKGGGINSHKGIRKYEKRPEKYPGPPSVAFILLGCLLRFAACK